MLLAIDDDLNKGDGLDKFCIKIWEEDDQEKRLSMITNYAKKMMLIR